ncbi:MAG: MBL fold metallo-hydrolase [Deltaproteobacteria bacterium]|nr:MBL fold metallo-hydrolase [Deltaproteobacteria bacterium]
MKLLFIFLALALLWPLSSASAQANPPYFKTRVGDLEVIALSDATSRMGFDLLIGLDSPGAAAAAKASGLNPDDKSFPGFVNVFLVKIKDNLVLIDTGNGPQSGLSAALEAAGVKREDIKYVFLTHFHGDHIGGLIDQLGQAAFKNAKVYASKLEDEYWLSAEAPFERRKRAEKALAPYKEAGKYIKFNEGETIESFVSFTPLYGHTPGHGGYLFESGGESLLVWGDIVHVKYVQFANPAVSLTYDIDPIKAAQTRNSIMEKLSDQKNVVVAGTHLPFPGLGRVVKTNKAFDFEFIN